MTKTAATAMMMDLDLRITEDHPITEVKLKNYRGELWHMQPSNKNSQMSLIVIAKPHQQRPAPCLR